jgi:hypothetical protein
VTIFAVRITSARRASSRPTGAHQVNGIKRLPKQAQDVLASTAPSAVAFAAQELIRKYRGLEIRPDVYYRFIVEAEVQAPKWATPKRYRVEFTLGLRQNRKPELIA